MMMALDYGNGLWHWIMIHDIWIMTLGYGNGLWQWTMMQANDSG